MCSVVVVLVFGVLAVRVAQLQVLSGNRYRLAALRQTVHTVPLPAQRGTIFDRDGRDLAMSIELTSVYADPQEVLDPIAYASELAPILDVSPKVLESRLADKHFQFEYLARRVTDDVVAKVKKLNLAGVGFVPESARQYPAGSLAGSLIGEVGGAGTGLSGLEALYQTQLAGKNGELVVERDQQGLDIPNTATHSVEAQRGTDLVLSLDEPLQWETEQALIDEVTASRAQGGMAAVVDVTTGDVLAMASIDGATKTSPPHPSGPTEQTRPLMDLFEPGSTNKLITLSTAIEDGLVTPETVINVPPALRVGTATFNDVDPHGDVKMTVAQILQQSSNIGTIEIAQRMSKDTLANALRSFGLGSPTTVAFPGQAAGLLLDPSHYYDTGLASTAIGYGVAVTGMQMLDAYVTIANGGVTRPPHLLDAEIDAKGVRHPVTAPAGHRVVSTQTSDEMTNMLTGVVTSGTGACASIPGFTVAGKTGTARKAVNGGYSASTMASFIGYAPATHPKLAAIVVLDAPSTQFGGTAAAPVFSDIMQFALTRDEVVPDDVGNTQFNAAHAAAAAAGTACTPPSAAAAAERASEAAAAAAQIAAAAATPSAATLRRAEAAARLSRAGSRAPSGAVVSAGTVAGGTAGTSTSGQGPGSGPTGTTGATDTPGTLSGDTSKSG